MAQLHEDRCGGVWAYGGAAVLLATRRQGLETSGTGRHDRGPCANGRRALDNEPQGLHSTRGRARRHQRPQQGRLQFLISTPPMKALALTRNVGPGVAGATVLLSTPPKNGDAATCTDHDVGTRIS